MYSSFWNLGLVVFGIGWARGIGDLCFLMFLFACWVFVFAFGFGFLKLFLCSFSFSVGSVSFCFGSDGSSGCLAGYYLESTCVQMYMYM